MNSNPNNSYPQVPVNWKKNKKDSAPNDGSVGIAVSIFFGILFLSSAIVGHFEESADDDIVKKALFFIGIAFLFLALLIRIKNHKRIAQRKKQQNAYKYLPYDTQSQWDMKIKKSFELRDRQLKLLVPIGTISFFSSFILLFLASWWITRSAGVPLSFTYISDLMDPDNPPSFFIQLLLGIPSILMISGFALLAISALISVSYGRPYTKETYKQTFVLPALANAFSNVQFNPSQGLNIQALSQTGVLMPFSGASTANTRPSTISLLGIPIAEIPVDYSSYVSSSNDYLSGTYRSVTFSQSDVTIKAKPKQGEDSPTVEYFSGRWLVLQSPKPINSTFYVWSKQFEHSGKPQAIQRGMQPIQLEDEQFNSLFEIYAQQPHDVFYMMTPPIIENLKNIVLDTTGKELAHGIAVGCQGAEIHLLVNKVNDAFEPDLLYVMTEKMAREKVASEVALITDMIDSVLSAKYN